MSKQCRLRSFLFLTQKNAVIATFLCVFFVWSNPSVSQQIVTYPKAESSRDQRASYPVAVLNLCANKSGGAYIFQPSNVNAQQGRSVRLLAAGKEIDVIWAVTNSEREELLQPIRIPIDRGLIGWRLLLIAEEKTSLFADITSAQQLAKVTAGQGHDWPDTNVLRENKLNVSTSTTYEGLFHMLDRGHIDYYPRSASEIWPEVESHADLNLIVQPTLVIHYPEALYFFVHKQNTALAEHLTTCLKNANADGSLKALFYEYYQAAITKTQFNKRIIIELKNTMIQQFPLEKDYWFSPKESPK